MRSVSGPGIGATARPDAAPHRDAQALDVCLVVAAHHDGSAAALLGHTAATPAPSASGAPESVRPAPAACEPAELSADATARQSCRHDWRYAIARWLQHASVVAGPPLHTPRPARRRTRARAALRPQRRALPYVGLPRGRSRTLSRHVKSVTLGDELSALSSATSWSSCVLTGISEPGSKRLLQTKNCFPGTPHFSRLPFAKEQRASAHRWRGGRSRRARHTYLRRCTRLPQSQDQCCACSGLDSATPCSAARVVAPSSSWGPAPVVGKLLVRPPRAADGVFDRKRKHAGRARGRIR